MRVALSLLLLHQDYESLHKERLKRRLQLEVAMMLRLQRLQMRRQERATVAGLELSLSPI